MTNPDSMVAKIQALFAKAESTEHPAEAATFQAKAEQLMAKYSVERAMLDAAGKVTADEMTIKQFRVEGIYAKNGLIFGLYSAIKALGTIEAYQTGTGGSAVYLCVAGRESDVNEAIALATSLTVQAHHALGYWWKSDDNEVEVLKSFGTKMEQFKARRQFMRSFGDGAATRIREQRRIVINETPGAELVVVDRAKKAATFMNESVSLRKGASRAHGGTQGAAAAGRSAGMNANIGTKGVGTTRGQIG